MQATCEPAQRRGRGRPPRPIPQWLLDALSVATASHRATLDRTNPTAPVGDAQLRELRLMLRAAAVRLGGRPRIRVTDQYVQFWLAYDDPAAGDDPADDPADDPGDDQAVGEDSADG